MPTQQEIADYVMPLVPEGSAVMWYKSGMKNGGVAPEVAFVAKSFHRNLTLYRISGPRELAVRHISDPKLQLNEEQRQGGAWDFTSNQKDYEDFRQGILSRMLAVESSVPPDSTQKEGAKSKKYHQLREFAIEKGIAVSGNPPTQWLEDQLAAIGALT